MSNEIPTPIEDVSEFYDLLGKDGMSAWESEYCTGDDLTTALEIVEEGDRILDLACGFGRVALALGRKGHEVWGIDISSALIEAARQDAKHYPNVQYMVGDMRKLPYEAGFFNKVLCFWASFAHLLTEEDQLSCLNEIFRVLKPGGYGFMVLMNPDHDFWQQLLNKVNGERVVFPEYFPNHPPIYVHSESTLRNLMAKTRFVQPPLIELTEMNHSKRIVVHLRKE
jgi:ubiquinone/menaquinone biosynthesis C-methylase UbiE